MFQEIKNNNNEEAVIKILGKLILEVPELEHDLNKQLKVRNVIEEVLYNYDVITKETTLATSDIEEKLQMFLAVKKLDGLSSLTLENYQREISKFGSIVFKPLNSVTTMDIRMYLALVNKNVKETTLSTKVSILKTFFGWLLNEEFILKDPTKKIKTPKVGKRLRNALTEEELETLRNNCNTLREKALLEFIFSTGCRLSEVYKLNIKNINWQDLSIKVTGKGNKERRVYFTIKSKLLLKEYLKSRKDDSSALFVTSKKPHNRLGRRSIQKEINNIAKRAGFDKSVFPHLLRHTFATVALNNNMPVTVIQKLMGHESVDTTMIYAELDNSTLKQEYKKLS
ncbi:site-specific tyrosine recombinase/integron integrase [Clostridium massiliodielmoense]|uniref:site-specific tyrosine recombinase/integron integrase n=1 Tax=Clostridium massiliodielmoense TaxID=1776385 RepID=UPI000A26A6BA|nr:site-specific tyrosine recombinase/integron integrase [Clostridium massiliodielmoense]